MEVIKTLKRLHQMKYNSFDDIAECISFIRINDGEIVATYEVYNTPLKKAFNKLRKENDYLRRHSLHRNIIIPADKESMLLWRLYIESLHKSFSDYYCCKDLKYYTFFPEEYK